MQAQTPVQSAREIFEKDAHRLGKLPTLPIPPGQGSNQHYTGGVFPVQGIRQVIGSGDLVSSGCMDSSFVKSFETTSLGYTFFCTERTSDNGILLGGYGRNLEAVPLPPASSILVKFDGVGTHLWSRELKSDVHNDFYIESVKELNDGSIIVTGWHGNLLYPTSPPGTYADVFICKLSATGDIIWFKTFHSTEIACTTGNIRFLSVAEGLNGDLLFAGMIANCPFPKHLVVFKLNSAGIMQWNYTYQASGLDGYGAGIFYANGNVTVINKVASTTESNIAFLKLDYGTGNLISHKTWRPDIGGPGIYHFISNRVKSVILSNGNYCVYGLTLGSYNPNPAIQAFRYAVLEFDSNYDFVNGFGIVTPGKGNPDVDQIRVDADKRVLFSMLDNNFSYPDLDEYVGIIVDGRIENQRKKEIRNTEVFWPQIELSGNGSYVYINVLATLGQSNFWIEYSLMHPSDTASTCLGLQANFATIQDMPFVQHNTVWQPFPNTIQPTNNQNNTSTPLIFTASDPCIQKAICDTLRIHGNPVACDFQQDLTFTAFKRKGCGLIVDWYIEPSALQSFQVINDTTVKFRLNQAWQGWLYASMQTSCGLLKDSVLIIVGSSPGQVDIGPDASLCEGNTITINAQVGYATYLWSTGSSDPSITVAAPGIYTVNVTDACGNSYIDAIEISAAPPVSVNIGPDRIRCNQDTIHINAPPGFMNYTWTPDYFINTLTGPAVVVQPPVDTIYIVKAEQSAGCYGYDTVRVYTRTATPIQLGPDKSICSGDTLVLDAGTGFSPYVWSTGANSQAIKVFTAGQFFVSATNPNGCISRDTFRVMSLWPKPEVNLDKNPGLCEGSIRVLSPGNFSTYVWQDGSTQTTFTIPGIGTYYVTVTDNNACKGSDTTHVINIYPPPEDFIEGSAEICNYATSILKAPASYSSYEWSTGSNSQAITISQPGTYWLHVVDDHQCAGKDTLAVIQKQCITGFFIPSGFTPNNDGRNDLYRPFIGGNVKTYQFKIYNRWGEIVFSSNDLSAGWDGRYKGVLQDANVYVWTCTYQIEGGPVKFEKGTFVIIH